MSPQKHKSPEVVLSVSALDLERTVVRRELESLGPDGDSVLLFWADGHMIFRQGYYELEIPCADKFNGVFEFSRTAFQQWRRSYEISPRLWRSVVSTSLPDPDTKVRLHFTADGYLQVRALKLRTKWKPSAPAPLKPDQRVFIRYVPRPPESNGESHDSKVEQPAAQHSVPPASEEKMCVDFRVNVPTEELVSAIRMCGNSRPVTDLQLRTWGGGLILTRGDREFRIDCEGYIRGRAMISKEDVPRLTMLRAGDSKFITLVCEKAQLKILGQKIRMKRRAVPLPKVPVETNQGSQSAKSSKDLSPANTSLGTSDVNDASAPAINATTIRDELDWPSREASAPDATRMTSLADILRFAGTASEQQMADTGMTEIVAAARETAERLLKQAADVLKPLNITEASLRSLLAVPTAERTETKRMAQLFSD